jgi:DNA-binding response OmpR family regulator
MQSTRFRILFVEDHEDTRDLLVLVLNQFNYHVITTSTVAGAMALASAEKFDLFVFDSMLPDGTGFELCKLIRRTNDSTPILFYSALAYEKDRNEAFRLGAQRYLVKPVAMALLCETVAELIGLSRATGRYNPRYKSVVQTLR